jgi:hypothetical protein
LLARDLERFCNVDWCASGMKENARTWKHSYYINAVSEIEKRLMKPRRQFEQQTKAAPTGTALAVIKTDQEAVDAEWKRRFPHLRSSSYAPPTSASGSAAGRARGSTISLGGGKGIGAPSRQIGRK